MNGVGPDVGFSGEELTGNRVAYKGCPIGNSFRHWGDYLSLFMGGDFVWNRNTGFTHKNIISSGFQPTGGCKYHFSTAPEVQIPNFSSSEFGSAKVSSMEMSCPFRAAFFATKADLKARKWMQSFSRCYQANLQLNFKPVFIKGKHRYAWESMANMCTKLYELYIWIYGLSRAICENI